MLALGDNFYDNGVASTDDALWEKAFRSVYMGYGPSLAVPWHPVFGNHDYGYGLAGLRAQVTFLHHSDTANWLTRLRFLQVSRTTATDDDEVSCHCHYSRMLKVG